MNETRNFFPTSALPLVNFIRMSEKQIKQHDNPRVNSYLREALDFKKPYGNAFYPIWWIDDVSDNSANVTEHIISIMDPSENVKEDLEIIFNELLSNIYNYSKFDMGFVMAQYFPEVNESEYAFIDNGIGFINSDDESDIECDCILNVIESNKGLSNVIHLVTNKYYGKVLIVSNCCSVEFSRNELIRNNIPNGSFNGTLVSFRF